MSIRYHYFPTQKLFPMASPYDNLRKGALHRNLGVPEDENIPGGKPKMRQICRADVGSQVMVGDHPVNVTGEIKKQACFAGYLGGYHGKKKR